MAKKRKKIDCTMVPNVPGTSEASNLYKELSKLINNRPLTNLIYASYLQQGVADQMDAMGIPRNRQGQHRTSDVYDYFKVSSMKNLLSVTAQSKAVGFTDNAGNLIDFDGSDAYTKAQQFNNSNQGRVAYVVTHGDKFNILLDDKNSRTQIKEAEVNRALTQWQTLVTELNKRGLDINDLAQVNPQLINPGSVQEFARSLGVLSHTPNDGLSVKDIEMLLALNPTNPIVQNVYGRGWGSRTEVAQRMYDIIHDSSSTPTSVSFVNNVLDIAKQLKQVDRGSLVTELNKTTNEFNAQDKNVSIQQTIDDLNKTYNLDRDVFVRESNKVKKYSEAIADAISSLSRQIRRVEMKSGKTQKSEALTALRDKLLVELQEKKYAAGLADFLGTAVNYTQHINARMDGITNTGTDLEYAFNIADVVSQAGNLINAYYGVVSALSDANMLVNDISITDADKKNLQDLARSIKQTLDSTQKKVESLQEEAMMAIGKSFLGEHNALYGKDVADIILMKEAESSYMDYLYSIGRNSNAVVSMLGAIIRDAQNERDKNMLRMSTRISRATNKLYKSGSDSYFMYDEKGRIVSQYDWDTFAKEKAKYRYSLIKSGVKVNSPEYNARMQEWEDAHTTEVVVDVTSGRTERMPNYLLAGDFQAGWTDAQREYYNEMMQIKGEIGTILPNYAQHQYIAPQKRTTWDQVLKEGIKGRRSFRDMCKWFLEDAKKWKMREDDTRFRKSGIYVGGEEGIASISDYDNTILRQIPIFFIKKMDAGNLSHDFSSAISALASTAFNYDAMDGVKNIAEMMSDFVENNPSVERDDKGRVKADVVAKNAVIAVATKIRKKAVEDKTTGILDGFVLKHIYGVTNKNSENVWSVICSNLIGYTSLKGLAVNVKGALTNKYMGIIQNIVMASGGQYYNMKDLLKAEALLFGSEGGSTAGAIAGGVVGGIPGAAIGLAAGTAVGAIGMTGKAIDVLSNNRTVKETLIADFFDQAQEAFSEFSGKRYHKTLFGRLYGSFNPMAMYSRGEYWIHMMNVYAILFHEKVMQKDPTTGEMKQISLYDALTKGKPVDGYSELAVKEDIYKLDGTKLESLEDPYFDAIKRRMRYVNQNCHGSMNKEDKGLVHQWMVGKMAMNFRQWMVEHYSRRFRQLHWDEAIRDVDLSNFYNNTKVYLGNKKVSLIDALDIVDNGDGTFHYEVKGNATLTDTGRTPLTSEVIDELLNKYAEDTGWRRGFKNDAYVILKDFIKERRDYQVSAAAYWDTLSETQKADVKQVLGEALMFLMLSGLSFYMGDPKDHNGEPFYRMWMYVVKRCLFDERAVYIPGAIYEADTLIKTLFPSQQTITGLLYPIFAPETFFETLESGKYRGKNKGWVNWYRKGMPFIPQIEQLLNFGEEDRVFDVFDMSKQITR